MVYSFHLNDAFQFDRSVRVVEEQMGNEPDAVRRIAEDHPVWGATAFWYALPARPAESMPGLPHDERSPSEPVEKPRSLKNNDEGDSQGNSLMNLQE